jgi:hypothetical protein
MEGAELDFVGVKASQDYHDEYTNFMDLFDVFPTVHQVLLGRWTMFPIKM